eukprot:1175847-Prorocentrum_minimum.AAC.2
MMTRVYFAFDFQVSRNRSGGAGGARAAGERGGGEGSAPGAHVPHAEGSGRVDRGRRCSGGGLSRGAQGVREPAPQPPGGQRVCGATDDPLRVEESRHLSCEGSVRRGCRGTGCVNVFSDSDSDSNKEDKGSNRQPNS